MTIDAMPQDVGDQAIPQPRTGLTAPGPPPDLDTLIAAKALSAVRVAVAILAKDDADAVPGIVAEIDDHLRPGRGSGLVDDVVVIDQGSIDATRRVAAFAGARVIDATALRPDLGPLVGRGDAMWRSLHVLDADVIAWIDADLSTFRADVVQSLVAPLLLNDEVVLVRGIAAHQLGAHRGEGGRVTEHLARPILSAVDPELANLRQPLNGEIAGRRAGLVQVPFELDDAVTMGLIIDCLERFGVGAVAQADLGRHEHRGRAVGDVVSHSRQVLRTVLARRGSSAMATASPGRPPLGEDASDSQ